MQVWLVDVAWEIWWSLLNTPHPYLVPILFSPVHPYILFNFFKFFKCACKYVLLNLEVSQLLKIFHPQIYMALLGENPATEELLLSCNCLDGRSVPLPFVFPVWRD